MKKKINKIGIIAMGNISMGGGYPKVVFDLISTLNEMGKEVYLLTPYKLNNKKIKQLFGSIKIKKVYNPGKIKSIFCIEDSIRRRLMKREFIEMAKQVDFIIDLCGGIFDRYLINDLKNKSYIIWGVSIMQSSGEWMP